MPYLWVFWGLPRQIRVGFWLQTRRRSDHRLCGPARPAGRKAASRGSGSKHPRSLWLDWHSQPGTALLITPGRRGRIASVPVPGPRGGGVQGLSNSRWIHRRHRPRQKELYKIRALSCKQQPMRNANIRLFDAQTRAIHTRALATARRLDGSTARRLDGSTARRLDGSTARRLDGSTARRLDGSTARRLDGSTARRLDGSTARRLDGSTARRLDGSTARRLDGSTARRLDGSTARRLDGSTARRLDGSTARRLDGSTARRLVSRVWV